MNIQVINDSSGNATGVFIPYSEWIELKNKYKELEHLEMNDIPEWHKDILDKRLAEYKSNPDNTENFDIACEDILKDL